VDAGWLLAAAALDVLGTPRRDEMATDYAALTSALARHVDEHSDGAPRLRTYWYDAAPGGAPTYEHDRIAHLPYVKVRLGRLARDGRQKGVDVLIYHDMLTLARAGVIGRAYLVAGDEDLREGVAEAQRMGVQVVLLGMPVNDGHNQSARLVRECDEYAVLPRKTWEPHCSARGDGNTRDAPEEVIALRRVGASHARDLVARADPEEVRALLAKFPHLPRDVDIELLAAAEDALGSLRGRPDLRTELRGTFWFALKEAVAVSQAVSPEVGAEPS
jgi:uncharacterized LabA/DUF88 family protein